MTEIIKQLLISSLWEKLLLNFLILYFCRQITAKNTDSSVRRFIIIPIILIARDIIFHVVNLPQILAVSDLLIIVTYYYWMRAITGTKKSDIFIYISAVICCAVIVLNSVFSAVPQQFHRFLIVLYLIYFIFEIYKISEFNTKNAMILIDTRKYVTLIFISYNIVMLLISDSNTIAYSVFVIFSYISHLYVLNKYSTTHTLEDKKVISGFEHELNSLFTFMRVIGTSIGEKLELATMLDHICLSARNNISADGASILLIDDVDNILRVEAISGIFPPPYAIPDKVKTKIDNIVEYYKSTPIGIGETILGEAIKTGEAIFIQNTADDPRMVQNTKNDLLYITSIIVIPLMVSNKILGILALCKRNDLLFLHRDFENIKTFTGLASLSLDSILTYIELLEKKEMERELGIAANIQQQLLPSKLPNIKNTDISAFTIPAKGVSGDYYDIIPLKKGKIALVMCDVAGKGIPASLVMIMIRTVIQLIAGAKRDASTIVSWINRGITGKIEIDHYATLSFLTYDPETGDIEYCNAGHHPLLVFRQKNHTFQTIDTPGLPIGIEAATKYEHKRTKLEKGDSLFMYTDGIIEAMDTKGNQYGYESMVRFIEKNPNNNPSGMTEGIRDEVRKFTGKAKQHDDQTLLVLGVK